MQTYIKRLVFLCCLALLVFGCSSIGGCNGPQDRDPCWRILFIGNSLTYTNDLPGMFTKLAAAGGHRVQADMAAQGGWTLSDHVNSTETLHKLQAFQWDFVILQEQSMIPSAEAERVAQMYPAARTLAEEITQRGAVPIFFLAWARRGGWPENGMPDYQSMQFRVDQGYLQIARELHARVAPVGYAWLLVNGQNPHLELWQPDGNHPAEQGTYLAACVFYAAIFGQSPAGLTYLAHLPEETASILQAGAADAVLVNSKQWNLP